MYAEISSFAFLPGQRKCLLSLGKYADAYITSSKNATDGFSLSQCSTILKELITSTISNANTAPQGRSYSDIIQWFSTYIYMHSGKTAYEILSNNLPIPSVGTVCKFPLEFQMHF